MREAGVTIATVAVFSWAPLEPSEGTFDFGWIDEVLSLLHAGGIAGRPGHRHGIAGGAAPPDGADPARDETGRRSVTAEPG